MAPAVVAALVLVLALVAPAVGASGPTALLDPSASPDAGVPTTTITLSVTYENREGSPPDYVRAVVNGSRLAMHPTSASESWRRGVRYIVAVKLPVGTHQVRFEAMDREKFTDAIAGPTVTIKPPPPTPTPAPTATSKPKPTATPTPTPRPTATPASTARTTTPPPAAGTPAPTDDAGGPGASPGPTGGPGATPSIAPAPVPVPGDSGGPAAPEPSPSDSAEPSGTPPLGAALPGPATGGSGGSGGSRGPGDDPYGGPAALFGGAPSLGQSDAVTTLMRVIPVGVATTGGVTMLMAFLVFGKRRRDQEPTAPDAVLAQRAATGAGFIPDGSLVPAAVAVAAPATVGVATPVPAGPMSPDAHMPRWRRPSLLEARKADPTRTVTTSVRLTFDAGVAASAPDAERRLIRYRLVSLLDLPDEVSGREIAVLDQGDEVVLLEKRGTFWRVLCPDGSQGWLHKMTLGDVVIDSSVSAGDSWTSGDEGPTGFEDVLRAYRERRGDLPAF